MRYLKVKFLLIINIWFIFHVLEQYLTRDCFLLANELTKTLDLSLVTLSDASAAVPHEFPLE